MDVTLMKIAFVFAGARTTCLRRGSASLATDVNNHILSMGVNGVPSGFPHCNEGFPCKGAYAPSGQNLDDCKAVHSEINMLLQCPDVSKIHTVYNTVSPCISCAKALLASGCKKIVFAELYPHTQSRELWEMSGRAWVHLELPKTQPDDASFY